MNVHLYFFFFDVFFSSLLFFLLSFSSFFPTFCLVFIICLAICASLFPFLRASAKQNNVSATLGFYFQALCLSCGFRLEHNASDRVCSGVSKTDVSAVKPKIVPPSCCPDFRTALFQDKYVKVTFTVTCLRH